MSVYTGYLIDDIREATGNPSYSEDATGLPTSGLSQRFMENCINEGYENLASILINVSPNAFVASKEIDVVAGQQEYTVPDNIYINNKIVSVEYSIDGTETNYIKLVPKSIHERVGHTGSAPLYYIRFFDKILLNPIPSSSVGKIRVSYYRTPDKLVVRSGQISGVTIAGGAITALTLDTATDRSYYLNRANYICINSVLGTVKTYNVTVPEGAYNAGTGVWTGFASHTLATGETAAIGDYVTIGRYTTTHLSAQPIMEKYVRIYAIMKVKMKDSSYDAEDDIRVLMAIEEQIKESFSQADNDINSIPIIDGDFS